MSGKRVVQRYVVLLSESPERQIWLGYDALGRIGNASFKEAFRYKSENEAELALIKLRRNRRFLFARIIGTTETEDVDLCVNE